LFVNVHLPPLVFGSTSVYYSAFVNFYTVARVTSRGRPMTLAWLAGWSLSHSRMRLLLVAHDNLNWQHVSSN